MKVFSVDLGSARTGWAYMDGSDLLSVGVWQLTSHRQQSWGVRWMVLAQRLEEVISVSGLQIDLVAFEEVRNHTSRVKGRVTMNVNAAHAYGASKAHLLTWCERHKLEFTSVTIQDVKGAATGKRGGKGTAKADVLSAARARWRHHQFETDDAADAAFVGLAAQLGLGWIQPDPSPSRPQKTIF